MGDRQNTIVCIFDQKSPRITVYHIHEWLQETLRIQEDDIRMIQIDGPQRRVYIKSVSTDRMMAILKMVKGQLQYHHENAELSIVKVEIAGLGAKRVRIADLPSEIPDGSLRDVLKNMERLKRSQKSNGRGYIDIPSTMA